MGRAIQTILTCHDEGIVNQRGLMQFEADDLRFEAEKNRVCAHEQMTFQQMEGFGGAFTQSAACVFLQLEQEQQRAFIEGCFSKEKGLGYTFCRTHIGSCDFSTYDYVAEKEQGEPFSINEDRRTLIPFIKRAMEEAGELRLLASPWSPPAWMKDNKSRVNGGHLLKSCYGPWADLLVKHLLAYRREGIDIWGITAQNEAGMAQRFESCEYSSAQEAEFIGDYLGPALRRSGLHTKVLIWDYNKHLALSRAVQTLHHERAAAYIHGMAVHWYSGDHFEVLDYLGRRYPDLALYATEACTVVREGQDRVEDALCYAHDIIGDLNNGVRAFIDWNLLLDERGGPSHRGNPCNAAIQVVNGELRFYPTYDYLAHFTRHIRPGAVRLGMSRYAADIDCTVWWNADASYTAVLVNPNKAPRRVTYACALGTCEVTLPGRSIMSLLY